MIRTLRIALAAVKLCNDSVTAFSLTFFKWEEVYVKVVYPICCGVDIHKAQGEVCNPCDLFKVDMPETLKKSRKRRRLSSLLSFLRDKG